MMCNRVSCLASTSTGELRLLKNDGIAKFGGKNQPFVDTVFASAPGSGFPNSSPEVGQRKWAKGVDLGNNPALHSGWRGSCSWQGGAGRGWAPWRGDRPAGGDRVPGTLSHHCQAAPEPQAQSRCGRMGNAATERCTRTGNEAQEQLRVGMRGEFTWGQSPSPFIFGRFGF